MCVFPVPDRTVGISEHRIQIWLAGPDPNILKNLDGIHYAPTHHGACLLVCGAQDEPFPITWAKHDRYPAPGR